MSSTARYAERERIAVVGLGYVGLPIAVAMAAAYPETVGYDADEARVRELLRGCDSSREVDPARLRGYSGRFTADPTELAGATFIIVAVPTPIDGNRQPDLGPLRRACEIVGPQLRPGTVVAFESTVYPGVTEEFCRPRLARCSGLRPGVDFTVAYSPERINPGDRKHRLETIVKVVAGEDAGTLERTAAVYGSVVEAGVYRAPSIRVAEAAKVIENTQRDLNIALVNELAIIFDKLGIRTREVLEAAGTKWNFLPFVPGLVGGHCIGIDPYYLTAKAEQVGYHPEVILAGRRINDGMGGFVAQKAVKLLAASDRGIHGARAGILGVTFKENVPDIRNSRVPDIVQGLAEFRVTALVHDPIADPERTRHEYGVSLVAWEELEGVDALIVAVPHRWYLEQPLERLLAPLGPGGVLVDVKSALRPEAIPPGIAYWSL